MENSSPLEISPPLATATQHATRSAFLIAGLATAAWAPLVPYAKSRLGVDDATLGLLLLCLGIGSLLSMPVAGVVAARFGCRAVIVVATIIVCLTLPQLALADSIAGLVAALLIFGAGIGTVDVVMNIQAVIVEKAAGRTMMSGFHGLYSLGGIVGAGCSAGLLGLGLSPFATVVAICIAILALLALTGKHLLPYAVHQRGPALALPRGIILVIGLLCFLCFLAEGAMLDWSAVFLTKAHNLDPAHAGLGYAAFSSTMTVGRLCGDRLVRALGGRVILATGGVVIAAGLALAVIVPFAAAALFGFALVGIGASNVVPVLYSTTGRQTVMPPHLAVAAVTTLGYAGILAGPAAIGFIAHVTSLQTAFLGVAVLLLLLPLLSRVAR